MATEFYIPKMSDHMEEGVFLEWLVEEGESVEKGQPILVIDTDKVVAEVEAPESGFLTGIRPGLEDGVVIPVGEAVAFIVDDLSEEVPALDEWGATPSGSASVEVAESTQHRPDPLSTTAPAPASPGADGGVRATPAGRKAARELGVDLSTVVGSGPNGRVSESDVRNHSPEMAPLRSRPAQDGDNAWLELTPVQAVTARRMVESVTEIPQFCVVKRLDMSAVMAARSRNGGGPSVTAFLVRAVASALADHPRVNGFFRDGRIQINPAVNVGVALGTSGGLYVPVVHNADRLSTVEISTELHRLQGLADGAGFSAADLEGGTFTLSNLGMYDVEEFRAIVNPPQAAILATGTVTRTAVVGADEAIDIRDLMTATITADHRSLDGIAVAQFMASVSAYIAEVDAASSAAP